MEASDDFALVIVVLTWDGGLWLQALAFYFPAASNSPITLGWLSLMIVSYSISRSFADRYFAALCFSLSLQQLISALDFCCELLPSRLPTNIILFLSAERLMHGYFFHLQRNRWLDGTIASRSCSDALILLWKAMDKLFLSLHQIRTFAFFLRQWVLLGFHRPARALSKQRDRSFQNWKYFWSQMLRSCSTFTVHS